MTALIEYLDERHAKYNDAFKDFQRYWKLSHQAYRQAKIAREWVRTKRGYLVFLDGHDAVYNDVVKKLRAELPQKVQRTLLASSVVNTWDYPGQEIGASTTFAGDFDRVCEINGHKMRVTLQVPTTGKGAVIYRSGLYFYARTAKGRDAVVDMIAEYAKHRHVGVDEDGEVRDPTLYVLGKHGDWQRVSVPWRPLDSVILPDGQMDRIVTDLETFLGNESFYVRRSIPWHRGYLFHGPPGTGKTSLVRAMAKHFGLDLWTVPLGDLKKDSDLVSLVGSIRQRSILLLEDVDVYAAARSRKQKGEQASLSGLLNALDGVATPHGLITVLTTNHLDVIDPALLRPGRVDLAEELVAPNDGQLRRLFTYFYEQEPTIDLTGYTAPSTAAVTELFKQHLLDPAAAEQAILAGGLTSPMSEAASLEVVA